MENHKDGKVADQIKDEQPDLNTGGSGGRDPEKTRIAIIGAGAAGLTAAETLRKKGYKNITVLERSWTAGGKCSSVEIEGKIYELGAGVISTGHPVPLQLAKEFNVPTRKANFGGSIMVDAETGQQLPKETFSQKMKLFYQVIFRYRRLLRKYNKAEQPGFSGTHPDLAIPFSEFAKKHNIEYLAEFLAPFFTGYGYGYFEEIPTAYVLKYYSWGIVKGFVTKKMYTFPEGIMNLWTTVAKAHDVRYNTAIKKIDRSNGVTITTETEELQFDELIIASPLDDALLYLDASDEEKELFGKIKHIDYRTYALEVEGLPKMSGYVPANYNTDRLGEPVFWYNRHADTNIYTFYVLGDWKMSAEKTMQNITLFIERMGGSITKNHGNVNWVYFPHIGQKEMAQGYFDRVEALQGKRNTHYVGELMNFSTVGLTSEYAETLVQHCY